MIGFLSDRIVGFVKNHQENFDDEMYDIYHYGVEITISSILNVVLILLLGLITGSIVQSIVFLICFIFVRRFTGGWHASSYFACNSIFCILFLCVLVAQKIFLGIADIYFISVVLLLCLVAIIVFAPAEHPNKKIENKKKMKILSSIIFFVLSVVAVLLFYMYPVVTLTLVFTLVSIVIAMLVGKATENLSKNN